MSITSAVSELEALVDKHTLKGVLQDLEEVCHLKASHIEEAWQDKALAQAWSRDANAIARLVAKMFPSK